MIGNKRKRDRKLILTCALIPNDANPNRHALRPKKKLEYLPKKAKIQILIENPDPMFTSETQTKGISNRP